MSDKCIVFDLDDTLYKEIEFVKSAYRFISARIGTSSPQQNVIYKCLIDSYSSGRNPFEDLNNYLDLHIPIARYLTWYRNHIPDITLSEGCLKLLDELNSNGWVIGIISDGRSISQRNKIKALGLESYISDNDIIISEEFGSEKPSESNYRYFMMRHPQCEVFLYIGDNVKKDFIAPNKLGWLTVGIKDNGENIHKYPASPKEYQPQIWLSNINELIVKLKNIF